jgi:hypothetical protein
VPRSNKKRQQRLARAARLARSKPNPGSRQEFLHDTLGNAWADDGVRMDTPEKQDRLDRLVDGFGKTLEDSDGIDPELTETFKGWLRSIKAGDIESLRSLDPDNQIVALPLIQIVNSHRAWSRLGAKARDFLTALLAEVGMQPPASPVLEHVNETLATQTEVDAAWHDWLVEQIRARKTAIEDDAQENRVTRQRAWRDLRRGDPDWSEIQRTTWATFWKVIDNGDAYNRLSPRSRQLVTDILTESGFNDDDLPDPRLERLNDAIARRPERRVHGVVLGVSRTAGDLKELADALDTLAENRDKIAGIANYIREHLDIPFEQLAADASKIAGSPLSARTLAIVAEQYGVVDKDASQMQPSGAFPLKSPISLPEGLKRGDPIYADDKLFGHVDFGGEPISVEVEGKIYRVPMLIDGPDAQDILAIGETDPEHIVAIRIGGPPNYSFTDPPEDAPRSWISQSRTLGDLQALSMSLDLLGDAELEGQFTKLAAMLAEHPELTDALVAEHYTKQSGTPVTETMVRYVPERYGPGGRAIRLPSGMQLGDPIYGDDKLIGHVDKRGDAISLITPENEEFKVPLVLDGPYARELLDKAKVTPDIDVSIRIGGPPRKLEVDESPNTATLAAMGETAAKLIRDQNQHRHTFGPDSLGSFTVNAAGMLSFKAEIDNETVTLEARDPDVVNTFVDDRAAGKSLAETIEHLYELGRGDRMFQYRPRKHGDAVSRAIEEIMGEKHGLDAPRVPPPTLVSVEQLAYALAKAHHDESYKRTEQDLGKLAAEWTSAGGNLEDFSRAMAAEPNGRPISSRELERLKQEYLLSGQGIRDAVGGPVAAGQCDFCDGSAPAAWIYPAENFSMQTPDGLPWQSDGAWAACAQCANLIERDDRVALANRYLATKPKAFHDVLRPWTIRLHNQFVRRRTGDRIRYERPVVPQSGGGSIEVMTAEQAERMGMHDLAARVRESNDVVMTVENEQGGMEVIAEGTKEVDLRIERRSLARGYIGHPLIGRLRQHIRQSEASEGMWHSTEPWQVLAEKYSMTMSAAASLGLKVGADNPGTMYFDPVLLRAGLQSDPAYADELGLSIARSLHDAVPYLWLQKVDELASEADLPAHTITRDLLPDPVMYWSFEDALGPSDARIDWMLIRTSPHGYEVWCPQADDVRRPGSIMLTGMLVGYGKRWPEDFRGPSGDLAEFLLKRLAFVNSKYVDVPKVMAHRSVRRAVEREIKPGMVKPPEDLAAYVVHLREREQPTVVGAEPGNGPNREYKHHWWRRAHNRVIHRGTEQERVTWVQRHLCGDPNLPPVRNKVKVVSR